MKNFLIALISTLFLGQKYIAFGFDKIPMDSMSKTKSKKSAITYFEGNFKAALAKAKSEGKMIFIDSYTSWCGPCKVMSNLLASDEKLVNYLNDNFVCLYIDMEKGEGPRLKRKYPHGTFPTLLFIKNDGRLKNRFVGLPNYGAAELLNFAKLASR